MDSTIETRDRDIDRPEARNQRAEHTMRWVLAHEPPVVFDDAAAELAALVREKTDGAVDVKQSMLDEFENARGGEHVSRLELVRCLQRGEIEMAHVYVAALGAVHDPLWSIELPFLFSDYAHAERVFEGPVAERLMAGLPEVGLRGLGFAYSGGFRIVASLDRELHEVRDYEGMRLRTSGNPVPEALYQSLGASAVGADLDAIPSMVESGSIEGCEITYVRFQAAGLDRIFPVVNETHHSLFTTMMVVNDKWFSGLPDAHQAAIAEAGRTACRTERRTAIREEQKALAAFEAAPSQRIIRMKRDAQAELAARAGVVTEQLAARFGEDLVDAIQRA